LLGTTLSLSKRRRTTSFDQALTQPALSAQPFFDAAHASAVALVVVAEEMQEPVQREDAQLGGLAVARVACLALRHAAGDYDVSEKTLHHGGHRGRGG